jgi:transmembrane sensor
VSKSINDIDELIGKHLAGESSPEEALIVKTWCDEHPDNLRYFNHCKLIFDRSAQLKGTLEVDEDAAWNKLKSQLRQDDHQTVQLHPEKSFALFWKIAAGIIVIMGVSFFAYRFLSKPMDGPVEMTATRKTVVDTLPDGSEVVLNKQTQLKYAYDKKNKEHTVKLRGEAYFNIHHDEQKKFIVDAEGVFIRDIGTSFNVKAYPESNTIEVVVEEGEVVFYTETDSGVSLKAGGKGVYNKTTKTFSIELPENNVTSYKTGVFVFEKTPLKSVVDQLNRVYDKKIFLSDSLADCPITVDFTNERIEEIVAVINETHPGISVKETAEGIFLEGKCEQE